MGLVIANGGWQQREIIHPSREGILGVKFRDVAGKDGGFYGLILNASCDIWRGVDFV